MRGDSRLSSDRGGFRGRSSFNRSGLGGSLSLSRSGGLNGGRSSFCGLLGSDVGVCLVKILIDEMIMNKS